FFVYVIAGRVIPFFTNNAIQGCGAMKVPKLEIVCFVFFWLLTIGLIFNLNPIVLGGVSFVTGILSLVRSYFWRPLKTLRNPLLWILHVGHLWVVLGFILLAVSLLGIVQVPISVGVHAFASGALATFIIGMMSRVSLGHTGRKLVLPRGF